jgi:hypothetical protein
MRRYGIEDYKVLYGGQLWDHFGDLRMRFVDLAVVNDRIVGEEEGWPNLLETVEHSVYTRVRTDT